MTKDSFQEYASEQLISLQRTMMIVATGVGKSKIAILSLKKLYLLYGEQPINILVVTSNVKSRDDDWPKEFMKWDASFLLEFTKFICYESLVKEKDKHYNVIILDEVHNISLLNHIGALNADHVIGMTATEPIDKVKKTIAFKILNLQVVVELDLIEAIERGYISPFKIIKIEIELDNIHRYVKSGNKNNVFYTTEKEYYTWITNTINKIDSNTPYYEALIRKRLHFINKLKSKAYATKKMLEDIKDKRVIVFSKSIDSAELINPNTYHSKSSRDNLEKFVSGESNILSVVNGINEAVNIPEIELIIINQINSSKLTLIQQIGRMIRFREGFEGLVYILVAKNTVDENWFRNAIGNLSYDIES